MPPEGEDVLEHLVKKYGPAAGERFHDPNSSMKQSGRAVGIEFTNDRRIYNTIKAHTLVEYVKNDLKDNEKANAIMEDLYGRYFERGQNIDDVELLQAVAENSGHTVDAQVLDDSKRHDEIRAKDMSVKRRGVHGVPFFIIEKNDDDKEAVSFSGAYPPPFIAEQLIDASGED